ncbi:DUF1449 family protein [Spirulina sp. CS-785/01]|uniref:OB-fold-containig protein n=1 Tax=Spirulina sp. CS-785/01 TaxID=3021716 RepID=UPI00232AB34C|nr:OB-fold-containig protein [Spirulina sp. CS-785/01]MDB9312669.1 DUF1449 family protein [Spirulina sp. CS-785/01]
MLTNLVNLPYWIILGIGILLFLVVIASGGGDDDFDLDMDENTGDGFWQTDADTEVDSSSSFGMAHLLGWFGIGKVPLIVLLATNMSLWGLTGWVINIIVGELFGIIPTALLGFGGVILVGSFVVSFYLGGLISRPVGQMFVTFGEDASGDRLIGCLGTVSSKNVPLITQGTIGQVDVSDPNHNLVSIGATRPDWSNTSLTRGQKVIVIDRRPQSYLVIAKDSSDEDRWLSNLKTSRDSHKHS